MKQVMVLVLGQDVRGQTMRSDTSGLLHAKVSCTEVFQTYRIQRVLCPALQTISEDKFDIAVDT